MASGAKVQPPGEAAAESGPSARQPGAAEVASDAAAQPPEGAAESGAGVQRPEAAGVALDAVAEPQQAVAAGGRLDAEALRPGVGAEPAP